jgi:hypothetical protein
VGFAGPARVALRFRSWGGDLYESAPLYVRPGPNPDLRVPLDGSDFRATSTGFRHYDAALDRTKRLEALSVVFYGRDLAGRAELSRLRAEGLGAP